jgi:plasmid stability protein
MDTTIRNLDERLYRRLRARAVASGMTVGEAMNEAMRAWVTDVARSARESSAISIRDLAPQPFPKGNERLSEELDDHLYGAR